MYYIDCCNHTFGVSNLLDLLFQEVCEKIQEQQDPDLQKVLAYVFQA